MTLVLSAVMRWEGPPRRDLRTATRLPVAKQNDGFYL
jgi:hypothetical protein